MHHNSIRVKAAHDYDKQKAGEALDNVANFIQDADKIYQIIVKGKK